MFVSLAANMQLTCEACVRIAEQYDLETWEMDDPDCPVSCRQCRPPDGDGKRLAVVFVYSALDLYVRRQRHLRRLRRRRRTWYYQAVRRTMASSSGGTGTSSYLDSLGLEALD